MPLVEQKLGNCQLCMRLQVINDDGQISQHGFKLKYQEEWLGWRMGKCGGSGHPAWQLSCDYARHFISICRPVAEVNLTSSEPSIQSAAERFLVVLDELQDRCDQWAPGQLMSRRMIQEQKQAKIKTDRAAKKEAVEQKKAETSRRAAERLLWREGEEEKALKKARKLLAAGEKVLIYTPEGKGWANHFDREYEVIRWLEQNRDTGRITVERSRRDEFLRAHGIEP